MPTVSLIAGHFNRAEKSSREAIEQRLKSFTILPGEQSKDYESQVFDGRFGHLVCKVKEEGPGQVRWFEDEEKVILTLGFHDFLWRWPFRQCGGGNWGRNSAD